MVLLCVCVAKNSLQMVIMYGSITIVLLSYDILYLLCYYVMCLTFQPNYPVIMNHVSVYVMCLTVASCTEHDNYLIINHHHITSFIIIYILVMYGIKNLLFQFIDR